MSPALRQHATALRVMVVVTILFGVAYPLAVAAIGHVAFSHEANGSLVSADGRTVGSSLLGQAFSDAAGRPLAQWFQPRPSSAGAGYDPLASGASNLGPSSKVLVDEIERRRAEVAAFNHVPARDVPPDAVTSSGSGLDPDISPAYAYLQVPRVAAARALAVAVVRALVARHVEPRQLGVLGDPRVNVLELNVALAGLTSSSRP